VKLVIIKLFQTVELSILQSKLFKMKKHYLIKIFALVLLFSAQLGTSQGLSDYCGAVLKHLNINDGSQDDTGIKVTVSNVDANTIYVEIESDGTGTVTTLLMDPAGETSRDATNDGSKFRITLTYATAPATVNLVILWNKDNFGGNRQLNLTDIPFTNTCNVDPADDVTLSDLTLGGSTITDFSANKTSYTLELAAGTTTVPTVTATATQSGATAVVTPAAAIPGTTTVLVTSSNTNQTATVSINFVINTPGVAAPTPLARDASEVVSVYSNGYADVPVIYNPFGGSTKSLETIAGRPTIKLAELNFSHLQMNNPKLDLTGMTHIHFDAWTPNATKIRCRLESGGGSNVDFDNPVLREWKGYDILLSSYPDPSDKTALEFIIFASDQAGAHDEILFLDNIYFYKAEIPTSVGALSKYCATEVKHLNIPAEVNSAVNLTISNIDATSMYIELEAPSGATALTGTTIDPINGVAGVTVETSTGVFRTTFTFTTAPSTIAPVIQWNNGTNWIIRIADVDGSLPFSASCDLPTATTISASETTTADVTAGDLTVAAGQTYTVAAGHTLTVLGDLSGPGELVINSGASLITSDGKTIGNVTVKRNTRYADGKYSFVGSPVNADASITGADLGPIVYKYNETTAYGTDGLARWEDATSTQLTAGKGYAQANQQEVSFTGVPNDGTITVSGLSHTAPDANHGEHGWSLLSNPYPAAIDVTTFLTDATNSAVLNGSIYLWDDHGSEAGRGDNGDYLTANSLGAVGGPNGGVFNGYIGSMQGFFVKVASPTASASVQFTESMRVGGVNTDGSFFRKDNAQTLNVRLALQTESGLYNELLVGLRENATIGVDRSFDADKLIADQDLQFYSMIESNKYAIQGLPLVDGVSTELAFNLGEASALTLSVKELVASAEQHFYLYDKVTAMTYDLNKTESISFSASKGADQNRFVLTYSVSDVLANETLTKDPIYRFANNELTVSFNGSTLVSGYAIYDLSGKAVSTSSLNSSVRELTIPINRKGINIIRIVTAEGTFTRKFLF
jgi:hypothetical protein